MVFPNFRCFYIYDFIQCKILRNVISNSKKKYLWALLRQVYMIAGKDVIMDSNFSIGSRPQMVSFSAGKPVEMFVEKIYTNSSLLKPNSLKPTAGSYIEDMSKGFDWSLKVIKKMPKKYFENFIRGLDCVMEVLKEPF